MVLRRCEVRGKVACLERPEEFMQMVDGVGWQGAAMELGRGGFAVRQLN